MSQMFRSCPECGGERMFLTHHDPPGTCPDAPDGVCPEWSCTGCGTALLAGFVLYRADTGLSLDSAGRVA